jgi:hypothetical protein
MSKIDLDPDFEYPASRRIFIEVALVIALGIIMGESLVILVLYSLRLQK